MSTTPQSPSLSTKFALAGGALLFVSSFLPWYHASATFAGITRSASHNGWHSAAFVVWLLGLAVAAVAGARVLGVLALREEVADRLTVALVGATAAVGVLHVAVRLANGMVGWGVGVGAVALLALVCSSYALATGGAGRGMLEDARSKAAASRG